MDVASEFTSSVAVIPRGTDLVGNISLGQSPYSLLFDPQNNYIYTANYGNNGAGSTVSVISGTKLVANVQVGSGPDCLAYNPSNEDVYVGNYGEAHLSLISGTKVVGNVTVPDGTFTMAYDPSNEYVYATSAQAGSEGNLTVVSNERMVATIEAGIFPDALLV